MYWLLNFAMEHIRKNKSTHSTCNNETRIHDTSQRAKLYDSNLAMEIDFLPKGIVTLKNSFITLFNS